MENQFLRTDSKFDRRRTRVKICPCGRSNKDLKFAPFVGYTDKGRCYSCDKWFNPNEKNEDRSWMFPPTKEKEAKPVQYIDPELMEKTVGVEPNNLIKFLKNRFGEVVTSDLIEKYKIGTSKHFGGGSAIFWHISCDGKVHRGKVMAYNSQTGKRIKIDGAGVVTSVHHLLGIADQKPSDVLFGLHLLNQSENENKPVAICESEKSAIIASVYLPQFVWLACGSLSGLSRAKLKPLAGKRIFLFPDGNGYQNWLKTADKLKADFPLLSVSDLLEKNCTDAEKEDGYDLADYLLKYNPQNFTNRFEKLKDGGEIEINNFGYPVCFDEAPQPNSLNDYWRERNKAENQMNCQPVLSEISPEVPAAMVTQAKEKISPKTGYNAPYSLSSELLPKGKFWNTEGLWTRAELDKVFESRPKRLLNN